MCACVCVYDNSCNNINTSDNNRAQGGAAGATRPRGKLS